MKTSIQIYLYGAAASAGLCKLAAQDQSFSNFITSGLFSWGGFLARFSAAIINQ